jgi:hypothetical protein
MQITVDVVRYIDVSPFSKQTNVTLVFFFGKSIESLEHLQGFGYYAARRINGQETFSNIQVPRHHVPSLIYATSLMTMSHDQNTCQPCQDNQPCKISISCLFYKCSHSMVTKLLIMLFQVNARHAWPDVSSPRVNQTPPQ